MKQGVGKKKKGSAQCRDAYADLVFLWSRQLSSLPYLKNYFVDQDLGQKKGSIAPKNTYQVVESFHKASREESLKESGQEKSSHEATVRILVGLDEKSLNSLRLWARKNADRAVVIIEPRKAVLAQFFEKTEKAKEVLLDKQVLIMACENGLQISGSTPLELEYLARFCVHSAFTLTACQEIEQDPLWPSYRAKLIAHCSALRSIKREALLSPDILDHILRNAIPSLRNKDIHSIDWSDAPPIALCGAGPSLQKQIPFLKQVQNRMLIIAAGSSALALQKEGVRVDMVAGVCAFPEHYQRWRQSRAYETPVMTCLRVHPGVLKLMQGPRVHLPGLSASSTVCFVERQMGYEGVGIDYGMSVTTATLKALEQAKVREVFLLGLDLCYQGGVKYSDGIAHLNELKGSASILDSAIEIEDSDGLRKRTLDMWLEERKWIEEFFAKSAIKGFRVSGEGLHIEHVLSCSPCSLVKKIERISGVDFDAQNYLWSKIAQGRDQRGSLEHLSQMLYAACDDLEELSGYCEKVRQEMASGPDAICESLERVLEFGNQFEKGLSDFWSYREFLRYVHMSVKSVQEKEKFQMKKDLSLSEQSLCLGLFTLLAEQVVILKKRSYQVASALDLWIERHLEGNDAH